MTSFVNSTDHDQVLKLKKSKWNKTDTTKQSDPKQQHQTHNHTESAWMLTLLGGVCSWLQLRGSAVLLVLVGAHGATCLALSLYTIIPRPRPPLSPSGSRPPGPQPLLTRDNKPRLPIFTKEETGEDKTTKDSHPKQ